MSELPHTDVGRVSSDRSAATPRIDAAAWVQLTLFVVVGALLLFIVRVSRTQARWTEESSSRAAARLRSGLDELREAIALYHLTERTWPGLGDDGDVRTALAGFLGNQAPRNPLNGLDTIRVLPPGAPWPVSGDGTSGWLYRSATGEIRPDVPMELMAGGIRLYDL